MAQPSIWTEQRLSRLRMLHEAGYAPSEIAKALGTTRNAVLGKTHRMGLPPGWGPKRHPATWGAGGIGAGAAPAAAEMVAAEPRRNVSLLELRPNDCRWPSGERDYTFCGSPRVVDSSYCGPHTKLSRSGPRVRVG
jgi:GcrA cell cycle regulator